MFRKIFPLIALAAAPAVGIAADADDAISFQRDVRPILSDKCFACHGPDAHTREADLRLDTPEGALADLGGYAAIVPGDSEKSEVIYRITTDDDLDLMPPEDFHKPLKPEEIEILKRWVDAGAEYETHWSYTMLDRPPVPEVDDPSGFALNDLDRFLLAAQEARKISPSSEADKVTLARRLHLDLTGLPPTPEEIDAFLADDSGTAYSDLVERLLESKHFGERMAIFWLDLVRYADTIGYHSDNLMEVSAYRDYVIDAFNENLPYDRFVTEQLAGDLLPDATLKQRIASGYNRLLQTTEEGGAQPKEYMAIYAADRVRNVSDAFLGSTLGCAQCHDHKYDPFTMRDFYTMAAFFADVKERPNGRRQPNLKLPTPEEEAEMTSLRKNLAEKTIAKILASDAELAAKVASSREAWMKEIQAELADGKSEWTVIAPEKSKSAGGQELKPLPDGSVLAGGKKDPNNDDYTVTLKTKGTVTGIRLEALTHESLYKGRVARGGNYVLTDFSIAKAGKEIAIEKAEADFTQNGFPIEHALDEDPKTGWAGNGHIEGKNRTAMFLFADPVDLGEGGQLVVTMKHQSKYAKHNIGRFRLSLTESESPTLTGGIDVPLEVQRALSVTEAKRNDAQNQQIAAHFESIAPELEPHRKNLADWQKRLETIDAGVRTMLVSESLEEPRITRILPRGNWLDETGEIVEPAVPEFLTHASIEGRRATRLDLANWITSPENPLTSRAFVNRVWNLFFGKGISPDLADLGGQGQPPTHPELLDWLAVEFRDGGWDIKELVRTMVLSSAYRQTSIPSAEAQKGDPGNKWLTRQRRWRLEAEFVRDTALDLGGLLVKEIGGQSVKPYQPAGYWQHLNFPKREWEADSGDGLYRRGLYTFWCRTFPHPAMLAFDAPSREECTAERPRSNTPQQALVLLNDPQFVESSRAFAQQIVTLPADAGGRIDWAWKRATGREITDSEREVLSDLLKNQQARYASDAEAARAFVEIGAAPLPENTNVSELAAWTQIARAILNAYETTSRY